MVHEWGSSGRSCIDTDDVKPPLFSSVFISHTNKKSGSETELFALSLQDLHYTLPTHHSMSRWRWDKLCGWHVFTLEVLLLCRAGSETNNRWCKNTLFLPFTPSVSLKAWWLVGTFRSFHMFPLLQLSLAVQRQQVRFICDSKKAFRCERVCVCVSICHLYGELTTCWGCNPPLTHRQLGSSPPHKLRYRDR